MKHIIVISISFFFCCLVCSCTSKRTPINNLAEFVEELQLYSDNYAEEDWKNAEQTYEVLITDLEKYSSDYTDEELREIGRLKGQCAAIMAKYNIKELKKEIKDAMNEATGIVEGFAKEIKNEQDNTH